MAVKTNKQTFTAAGREYDTREEAERADKLYTARQKLEDAHRAYQKTLGESAKTADGEQFEFGTWGDYWRITNPVYSMPRMVRMQFICWAWSVRSGNEEVVEIAEHKDDGREPAYVPIRELYKSERAAQVALLAAQKQWLAERAEDVAEFGRKLKAGSEAL